MRAIGCAVMCVGLVGMLSACKRPSTAQGAAGGAAAPPAAVTVARPLVREVTDWDEYPGRLAAPDAVDVRARVSGYVERAAFEEGSIVKAGDVLFELDVRPFQAELNRATAQVGEAQAQANFAGSEFQRYQGLRQTGGGSETEFARARQGQESAQAALAAARAAAEVGRLNVEWSRVVAPIGGRVGRRLVTPGNLVNGGGAQATLLTTITSLDPIYCYFDVDERTVRGYQRLVRERARPSARETHLPCQLALVDEPEFVREGHIDFVNNQIDVQTGTINVRGVFANADRQLLPGFYGRLRVPGRGPYRATLVPEGAIGTNLAQQFVMTVGPDDAAALKPVTTGTSFGGLRVVEGIAAEDRVIVNGGVNVRPGAKVRVAQETTVAWDAATRPSVPTGPGTRPTGQGPARVGNAAAGVGVTGGGGAGTNGAVGGGTGGSGGAR